MTGLRLEGRGSSLSPSRPWNQEEFADTVRPRQFWSFLAQIGIRRSFRQRSPSSLKDRGVKPADVMANIRRYERKGLVYVRGYRGHDYRSPFREGYLITWIDQEKNRDQALSEAVDRTNDALPHRETTNPVIERVHRARDIILEATKLRDLVSFNYLHNMLKCSERGNVLLETEGLKRPNFIAMEPSQKFFLEGSMNLWKFGKWLAHGTPPIPLDISKSTGGSRLTDFYN